MWWPVHPLQAVSRARGGLFPWAPVFVGCGIGLWFALPQEPSFSAYASLALAAVVLSGLGWRGPELWRPIAIACMCLVAGPVLGGARAYLVSAPVMDFRYYGPVEGRVIEIDRSQADDLRITLDRVVLDRFDPAKTPRKVRVAIHGGPEPRSLQPGSTVILTGHLTAPPGPSEPGGFDFRRMAYFDGLGAVGYTTTPVLLLAPPGASDQIVGRLRSYLSASIMARVPGQSGAFASGAVTGDRSGITRDTVEALRDSNLSHLLAISGMNMAFITGFVFALIRYGVALMPALALRVNSKKIAAVAALAVAAFYLALSGANVATERAFVMVVVMLVAILADRRAVSLRSVAIAGLLLLAMRPESLLSPGFQMSFAATTVLIAGFAAIDGVTLRSRLPRWAMPVLMLVLSSVLAGVATAPLAAAHFNRFTDYGLIANLLTVPAMGLLIMPGAVMSVLLWPIGLQIVGLWMMGLGSWWILAVAHMVAGWDGSVTGVPTPMPWVLPVMAMGAFWIILWRGRARMAGVAPIAISLVLWVMSDRPAVLVSGDGAVVGAMGPEGRAMSSAAGAGFAVRSWLENDGDLADQEEAASRPGFDGEPGQRHFVIADWSVMHLKGKLAGKMLASSCAGNDLVIVSIAVTTRPPGCIVLDKTDLDLTGTVAIDPGVDKLVFTPAEGATRPWSRQTSRRAFDVADGAVPVTAAGQ